MRKTNLDKFLEKIGCGKMPLGAVFDDCCHRVKAAGKTLGVYTECHFSEWKRRGVDYMAIKNDTNAMLLGFREVRKAVDNGTN